MAAIKAMVPHRVCSLLGYLALAPKGAYSFFADAMALSEAIGLLRGAGAAITLDVISDTLKIKAP